MSVCMLRVMLPASLLYFSWKRTTNPNPTSSHHIGRHHLLLTFSGRSSPFRHHCCTRRPLLSPSSASFAVKEKGRGASFHFGLTSPEEATHTPSALLGGYRSKLPTVSLVSFSTAVAHHLPCCLLRPRKKPPPPGFSVAANHTTAGEPHCRLARLERDLRSILWLLPFSFR